MWQGVSQVNMFLLIGDPFSHLKMLEGVAKLKSLTDHQQKGVRELVHYSYGWEIKALNMLDVILIFNFDWYLF